MFFAVPADILVDGHGFAPYLLSFNGYWSELNIFFIFGVQDLGKNQSLPFKVNVK